MATRLLLLLAALCAGATAAPAAAAPISSAAQLFTCCTPEALQARMFSEAEASGAEYVRVDVELHGIFGAADGDPPDWTHLDRTIALARAHRVKVLGLIRGTPGWLSTCREKPKASICPPRDPARWGELAGEVAAHARGSIDHWEILNEPDARWAFLGSAEDYARMLSAAYGAIKQQAPEAQVVFGGVERPREHDWIERVLATPGADAAQKFDVAAVHLRLRLRNTLHELPEWLTEWRALLAHHGFHGPIWVTEHGYPADPAFQWDPAYRGTDAATGAEAQARLLHDSIPLLAKAGASQIFITLRDNLYGEYLSEGLTHIDDSQPGDPAARRAAFNTVRDLAIRWDPAAYRRSGAIERAAPGGRAHAAGGDVERGRPTPCRCRPGRRGRGARRGRPRPGQSRGLARRAPDRHPHRRADQGLRGRLVKDQLVLHRAPHAVDLGAQLLMHLRGLALERAHAPAHPLHLLLELEHLLHPGQVHPQLGGQALDAAQPLHVVLRVEAGVLGRALGGDQPARLVDAQSLRVHARQLGRHRDHVDPARAVLGRHAYLRCESSRSRGLPSITAARSSTASLCSRESELGTSIESL